DLAGPTAATAVLAVLGGQRAPGARTIGSTIAVQAPVTQGRSPRAPAPISPKTSIAQGGASISPQSPIAQ
ncbi:hypothetical protein N300_11988, partial [Calypte anna]